MSSFAPIYRPQLDLSHLREGEREGERERGREGGGGGGEGGTEGGSELGKVKKSVQQDLHSTVKHIIIIVTTHQTNISTSGKIISMK